MGAGVSQAGGRTGRGRRRAAVPMSDINVTPLVDVMLVLLIIFMVTAPMMVTGIPMNLPKTNAKPLTMAKVEPFRVAVQVDGTVIFGASKEQRDQMTVAQLSEQMSRMSQDATLKDRVVQVRADSKASYQTVAEVLAVLQVAGFTKIALETAPKN